jgi:hypothetical protein
MFTLTIGINILNQGLSRRISETALCPEAVSSWLEVGPPGSQRKSRSRKPVRISKLLLTKRSMDFIWT